MARAPLVASAALSVILSGCDWLINDDGDKIKPSTPAPVEGCPKLMHGIKCVGDNLDGGAQTVDDLAGCCELCFNTTACAAFTYRADTGSCKLKSRCILAQDWGKDGVNLNTTSATLPGRMSVQRGWTEVEGYKCSGQKDTVLFYPDQNGSYPVIVYGHGTFGAIDGMDEWLETISAQGFIIVAPFSGQTDEPCHEDSSYDMVHILEQAKIHGAALHPSLAMADWSRTGVFGHSRGGHYVPLAANLMQRSKHQLNVAAMVVSHASPFNVSLSTPQPAIPAMFTTGTLDQHDEDHHVYGFYRKYPALNAVYANLVGAHHMEPQVGRHLNNFTATFFSCHISRSKAACDLIYGKTPEALCQAYEYEKCLAHMNGPMLEAVDNTTISV